MSDAVAMIAECGKNQRRPRVISVGVGPEISAPQYVVMIQLESESNEELLGKLHDAVDAMYELMKQTP